jgi:hypothetical protein
VRGGKTRERKKANFGGTREGVNIKSYCANNTK